MEKRSKKRWTFTEKQLRHDRKRRRWNDNAPKWYRQVYFIQPWRARCDAILRKAVVRGEFENLAFPKYMKDANWWWF